MMYDYEPVDGPKTFLGWIVHWLMIFLFLLVAFLPFIITSLLNRNAFYGWLP